MSAPLIGDANVLYHAKVLVSIVMGLHQHRGQITGEWTDTHTGEARAEVALLTQFFL